RKALRCRVAANRGFCYSSPLDARWHKLCAFLLDRLENSTEFPTGALEGGAEISAGRQHQGHDLPDGFFAAGHLADGLDALLAGVDFAVEEDATKLERFVGLLLIQQRAGDDRDARSLAVYDGTGAIQELLKALD